VEGLRKGEGGMNVAKWRGVGCDVQHCFISGKGGFVWVIGDERDWGEREFGPFSEDVD